MDRKKTDKLAMTAILSRYSTAWHLGDHNTLEKTHSLAMAWVGGHVTATEVLEQLTDGQL